jgi:hypothetical protein
LISRLDLPETLGDSKLSIEEALEPKGLRNSFEPCGAGKLFKIGRGEVMTTGTHCFGVRTGSLNSGNALMHSKIVENFLTLVFFSSGIKYRFVEDRQIYRETLASSLNTR